MRFVALIVLLGLVLSGCGPAAPGLTPTPAATVPPLPSPTPVQVGSLPPASAPDATGTALPMPEGVVTVAPEPELAAIQIYLVDKLGVLRAATADLRATGDRYYALTGPSPDYARLWQTDRAALIALVQEGQARWLAASPLYEQIERIVAGVPSLARYHVILDTGTSGDAGGTNVAPFDLNLPDGRVLAKPGNLFGLTESMLWGSDPHFAAPGVRADFDGDGQQTPGEALPDSAALKGGLDALDEYSGQLLSQARDWRPSEAEAFTILATALPTIGNYLASWKDSPFVAGPAVTPPPALADSHLAATQELLASLGLVYAAVSPEVRAADPAQDRQLADGLSSLHDFVAGIVSNEQAGKRYTPAEADLLQTEAQDRATALTGQITQIMAQLGVPLQQGIVTCSGTIAAVTPSPTP